MNKHLLSYFLELFSLMTFLYLYQRKYLDTKRHEYYFGNLFLPMNFLSLLKYFFKLPIKYELQIVPLGLSLKTSFWTSFVKS